MRYIARDTFNNAQIAEFIDFVGSAADNYMTRLVAATPSADRTLTLPNNTGTLALTSEIGDGLSFDGNTANGVCTYKDADEISVESTLTYSSTGLLHQPVTSASNIDAYLMDVNTSITTAQEFSCFSVDLDKTGITDGAIFHAKGAEFQLSDNATNETDATSNLHGINLSLYQANPQGTTSQIGMYSAQIGGKTNIGTTLIQAPSTDAFNMKGHDIDMTDTSTVTSEVKGFRFDYDKSGVRGASTTSNIAGFVSDINDTATNDSGAGITYFGILNNITNANNTGSLVQYGLKQTLSGADIQYGIHSVVTGASVPSVGVGFYQQTDDDALDIKFVSAANANDYFSIKTGVNGATEIKTDDNGGGELGHLTFDIDGTIDLNSDGAITLDSGAAINLEPYAGSAILLDGTVSVDGGSVTGITTLGVDSVSLTAVQTSGETFADNDTSIMTSASIDDRINAAIPDETTTNGETFILKTAKVTITQSQFNSLHTTPVDLIAAPGANKQIVPISGTLAVDRLTTQANALSDLNIHYDLGGSVGLFQANVYMHLRRFMWNKSTDITYNLAPYLAVQIAADKTAFQNKKLQVSVDSILQDSGGTQNCIGDSDIYISYYILDMS